jgi:hypothetical protein
LEATAWHSLAFIKARERTKNRGEHRAQEDEDANGEEKLVKNQRKV